MFTIWNVLKCVTNMCVCHKISLNAVYKVNIFDSPSLNTWLLGIVIHRTEVIIWDCEDVKCDFLLCPLDQRRSHLTRVNDWKGQGYASVLVHQGTWTPAHLMRSTLWKNIQVPLCVLSRDPTLINTFIPPSVHPVSPLGSQWTAESRKGLRLW